MLAGEEPTESLRDVVMMLSQTSNPQVCRRPPPSLSRAILSTTFNNPSPQVEYIINVMKKAVREFDG